MTKTAQRFSDTELHSAFDIVKDPTDWRAPIEFEGVLHEGDIEAIKSAVPFFTATQAKIVYRDEKHLCSSYRDVKITAVGYRQGPAGP